MPLKKRAATPVRRPVPKALVKAKGKAKKK